MQVLEKIVRRLPALAGVALVTTLMMAGCGGSTSSSSSVTATPSFSPGGGTYNTTQSVAIADTTPNATLYCTTDGTLPTTSSPQCSEPTVISKSMYLQAIAVASGKSASAVASAGYTIDLNAAATPTFSKFVGGTYTSAQSVTIFGHDDRCVIYYTTDGSTPTASSTLYTGPISVSQSKTLSALPVRITGYNNSGVASTSYVINYPAATPQFSVGTGSYTSIQTVTITDSTPGATIYYTADSTIPSATHGTVYTGPITVASTQTIAAVAVASGYSTSDGRCCMDRTRAELPSSLRVYAAIFRRRTESGRPASSMRLRTATPTAASVCWPEKLRARRQGPMMALYRPIAVSTRARWP